MDVPSAALEEVADVVLALRDELESLLDNLLLLGLAEVLVELVHTRFTVVVEHQDGRDHFEYGLGASRKKVSVP